MEITRRLCAAVSVVLLCGHAPAAGCDGAGAWLALDKWASQH